MGETNNSIFIGHDGAGGGSKTIKIGTQGGPSGQTAAFIAGIFGQSVDGATDVAVLTDANGKLGTTISSRRYKFDIAAMPDISAMLSKLRPVTFRYKHAQNGGTHPLQYGLIAEEVAEVFPDLAVFKDGQPETVKYHLLPSFLLAGYQRQAEELRREKETNAAQADRIDTLEQRLRDLEARISASGHASAGVLTK
jgi:hypothetical protein